MKPVRQLFTTALFCGALATPLLAQESADHIWSGGPILTVNQEAMRAEAVSPLW